MEYHLSYRTESMSHLHAIEVAAGSALPRLVTDNGLGTHQFVFKRVDRTI